MVLGRCGSCTVTCILHDLTFPAVMQLTNLKAVQLLGAGVETVINNPDIPEAVPLLRVADPLMGVRLATWVSLVL
jgi:hypothetical protein